MQSLAKENMKFVSGAGTDSPLGDANSLILVVIAKPDDLGKIQDFFKSQDTAQQTSVTGQTQPAAAEMPFNSSQAQQTQSQPQHQLQQKMAG